MVFQNTLIFHFKCRSYLEKSVQLLMEGADELCQDAQKLHNYQRNNARQQQQIDAHKAKRVRLNLPLLFVIAYPLVTFSNK